MASRTVAVLVLLATATGCWTDSCATGTECTEQYSSIFALEPSSSASTVPGQSWCSVTPTGGKTCSDLGYTVTCGGVWYRPETAPLVCR